MRYHEFYEARFSGKWAIHRTITLNLDMIEGIVPHDTADSPNVCDVYMASGIIHSIFMPYQKFADILTGAE